MLHLHEVDLRYGRARVLFGISLAVAAGEVVALLGRNGAGKSSTLKTIMGLVPSDAGSILFDGVDIAHLPTFRIARAGLGYVPEDRRIFTDLTVTENLLVGRKSGQPVDGDAGSARPGFDLEQAFDLFPALAEMRHRPAGRMSGGEQQMLTLARTLMGNPRLLLLDEPSEGLAPLIVQQMAEALARLKRDGLTILVSEQNLGFVGALADRAYVLERGHIVHHGPMTEILADETIRMAYLAA